MNRRGYLPASGIRTFWHLLIRTAQLNETKGHKDPLALAINKKKLRYGSKNEETKMNPKETKG